MKLNTRTNRRLAKQASPIILTLILLLIATYLINITNTEPTYQECLNQWRHTNPTYQQQQCNHLNK